jgi:sterol desaturase/sphingolipid hydroxylase (fatty acid hydroxylase superfamily)
MEFLSEIVLEAVAILHLKDLATGIARAAVLLGVIFLIIYAIEMRLGRDRTRYLSRHFWNDLSYFLFYQSGLYNLLIGAMLISAFSEQLSFLKIDALASLPPPAHWVLYWVGIDFCDYWFHRWKHNSRFLWAFHAVHHSQEKMTFITSWRFHPLEQVIANIVMLTPMLVLGVPTSSWLPLILVMNAFEALQHSQLNWTYGPFYKVFVSPVFHAIHHSTEKQHHDTNYAKLFSAWDFMFGTGVVAPAPAKTGISSAYIEETLPAHMMAPFRLLAGTATPPKTAPTRPHAEEPIALPADPSPRRSATAEY